MSNCLFTPLTLAQVPINLQTLGWAGIIRVDGTAYTYLGEPSVAGVSLTPATQKSMTVSMTGNYRFHTDDLVLLVHIYPKHFRSGSGRRRRDSQLPEPC